VISASKKVYLCGVQGVRGILAAENIARDSDASYYKQTNNSSHIEAVVLRQLATGNWQEAPGNE